MELEKGPFIPYFYCVIKRFVFAIFYQNEIWRLKNFTIKVQSIKVHHKKLNEFLKLLQSIEDLMLPSTELI